MSLPIYTRDTCGGKVRYEDTKKRVINGDCVIKTVKAAELQINREFSP